jgi:hypothetical protein
MNNLFFRSTRRVLKGAASLMPDDLYLAFSHRRRIGRFPNMKRPKAFNEMILMRCLQPDPRWSSLADKLRVREYVRERIGEKYLIPLLAAPDVFTKDVFDSLPSSFVMKANHGSNFVEVVWDKSKRSFEELRRIAGSEVDPEKRTSILWSRRCRLWSSIVPRTRRNSGRTWSSW